LHISRIGSWYVYNSENSHLPSNRINNLFFDLDKPAFAGTDKGFFISESGYFNEDDGLFNYSNSRLPRNNIEAIGGTQFSTSSGGSGYKVTRLWIATDPGYWPTTYLSYLEINSLSGNEWETTTIDHQINRIVHIDETQTWVCTSLGLLKFDKLNLIEKFDVTNSGLQSDQVYDICYDKNQNIWIATANGLARYNPN